MTEIKQVTGMYYNDIERKSTIKILTVRVTQSYKGKTLSLADESEGIMLQAPLEPILKILKKKG